MNPVEKMRAFNKKFPDSKLVYRRMQQYQVENQHKKDGVYCPMVSVYNFSERLLRSRFRFEAYNGADRGDKKLVTKEDMDNVQFLVGAVVFGAWRNSLGCYNFDLALFKEIYESTIPPETPTQIFNNLPEWCVYINYPTDAEMYISGSSKEGEQLRLFGFWAWFDTTPMFSYPGSGVGEPVLKKNLCIILNTSLDTNDIFYGHMSGVNEPIQIAIDDELTVEQAVILAVRRCNPEKDPFMQNVHIKNDLIAVSMVLGLLLMICVEKPDISNVNGEPITREDLTKPKYAINKKTGVFLPPQAAIEYQIGSRLGGELRSYNDAITKSKASVGIKRKRPHIRKGHWHGVWSGTGQNKNFNVYWQAAIFVNSL